MGLAGAHAAVVQVRADSAEVVPKLAVHSLGIACIWQRGRPSVCGAITAPPQAA